jgi:hypothetical protein
MRALPLLLVLAATLATPARGGDQVVVYRCTDQAGHVTIQNDVACPAGSRQHRQVIDTPPALPAYVPREVRMPEVVAGEQAQVEARIAEAVPAPVPEAERTPPPALYQCRTWDGQDYLTGDGTPAQRCAPLQVVGLDGTSAQSAARACEQVTDQCAAVPEAQLCSSWRRRVAEAEFRWKFAGGRDGDKRLAYEQLAATLANSTCPR